MRRVTIKDVAAQAGVSFSTVSRVLADHPGISGETKKRVRQACRELGYVPNIAARGLVQNSTRTLGLIIPNISNPYFAALTLEIETAARARGYHLMVCNSMLNPAREHEVLLKLVRQQIDGLIISTFTPATQHSIQQTLGGTPCIFVGGNHDENCDYIVVDSEQGAYLGTRYLIELGHRDIALVGGHDPSHPVQNRLHGFCRAAEEAGVRWRNFPLPPGGDVADRPYELACSVLDSADRPSAIFAYSDHIAMGVLRAAYERKLRVPDDLSLLGFDNVASSNLPRVHLTSVSQTKQSFGALAVTRLLEKLAGQTERTHDILEPELIVRTSCRAVQAPA